MFKLLLKTKVYLKNGIFELDFHYSKLGPMVCLITKLASLFVWFPWQLSSYFANEHISSGKRCLIYSCGIKGIINSGSLGNSAIQWKVSFAPLARRGTHLRRRALSSTSCIIVHRTHLVDYPLHVVSKTHWHLQSMSIIFFQSRCH